MKLLLKILFWPGDMVMRKIGLTLDEDNGIFRSFINASVWGILSLLIALNYLA
jgi:hypothetical protein